MRTGIVNLPLHYGNVPLWLFNRMKRLSKQIIIFIIYNYGTEELLLRLSNPYWFQAFGCVLGFDWHSSGLTTIVCSALKEGIKGIEKELGFFIAGGKGKLSRKTPVEIEEICNQTSINGTPLIYASKISAKVDSSALQDGYQLYHHSFFFNREGLWAVIQQGMNEKTRYARRYHWFSKGVKDFVCEPHWAVCCDEIRETLNLVASESDLARKAITDLSHEKPKFLLDQMRKIKQVFFSKNHSIPMENIRLERLDKIFNQIYENYPENFEKLLGINGVGPKTIRSLSLIAELIFDTKPSFKDPTRFSFSHGGKDGHPYPVDKKLYDQNIEILKDAIDKAKLGDRDKIEAIRKLKSLSKFIF